MKDAIKRALVRMWLAADKAEREGREQRGRTTDGEIERDACERAERCEGQAHGLRAASRMLEEELAKVGVKRFVLVTSGPDGANGRSLEFLATEAEARSRAEEWTEAYKDSGCRALHREVS